MQKRFFYLLYQFFLKCENINWIMLIKSVFEVSQTFIWYAYSIRINFQVRSGSIITIIENIYNVSVFLMLLSTFCFYLYLRKIKRERKLTGFEFTMYIITQVSYILWGIYIIYINFGWYFLFYEKKAIKKGFEINIKPFWLYIIISLHLLILFQP